MGVLNLALVIIQSCMQRAGRYAANKRGEIIVTPKMKWQKKMENYTVCEGGILLVKKKFGLIALQTEFLGLSYFVPPGMLRLSH